MTERVRGSSPGQHEAVEDEPYDDQDGAGEPSAEPTAAAPRGRRWWAVRLAAAAVLLPLLVLVVGGSVLWFGTDVPAPGSFRNPQASVIRYADGTVLARTGIENRTSVELGQVSEDAREAVLAAEDRDYYSSHGISPRGIVRAFWANLRSGEIEQGGSTITQQYARNAFLSSERTLSRKLREAVIAIKLDRSRSKDELLERYLNTVYFGRGAYGIEAAARTYFGTTASELTASQGAVLASLLKSPSAYDPARNPELARERWRYVLDGMVEEGWLTHSPASLGYPEVRPPRQRNELGGPEGYLVQQALEELADAGYSEDDIDTRGFSIVTTIDRKMQQAAVDAVTGVTGDKAPKGVFRALVSVEPGTGRIRASYGGPDFVSRPFDAVTQGRAQAGSSFKPYVLAAALKDGISLRTRFDGSSPQRFGSYEVKNFGRGSGAQYGRIDLVDATRSSVNTVYVPLGMEVGTREVARTARELGITTDLRTERDFPSISLGTPAVTPLEQATAYATLAAQGVRAQPHIVERVEDAAGEAVYEAPRTTERVLSPEVAADVTHALRQVVQRGSGRAAQLPARPAAGKTGTTTGNTAAWFVGYTPGLATAVALYTDGSDQSLPPMAGVGEVTGGSLPARVWSTYMRAALFGRPAQGFPEPAFVGDEASPSPSPTPEPSRTRNRDRDEPTREPKPDPEPAREPTPSQATEPRSEPTPTSRPSREPERTPRPQPTPTPEPQPDPTTAPQPSRTPTPQPTRTPAPQPTRTPAPQPSRTPPPTSEPDPPPPPDEESDPLPSQTPDPV